MGGDERIQLHHDDGKLTARERIAGMADEGTFREFKHLVGEPEYDAEGALTNFLPKGMVEGKEILSTREGIIRDEDCGTRG